MLLWRRMHMFEEVVRRDPEHRTADDAHRDIDTERRPEGRGARLRRRIVQGRDSERCRPPKTKIEQTEIAQQQPGNGEHPIAIRSHELEVDRHGQKRQ